MNTVLLLEQAATIISFALMGKELKNIFVQSCSNRQTVLKESLLLNDSFLTSWN